MSVMPDEVLALVDLIGRTGASDFKIQYDDSQEPVVWNALAKHGEHWSVGAGLNPITATFKLTENLVDGGQCTHCKRPTGVTLHFDSMPLEDAFCWYQYDPENKTMRRGCE